MIKFIKKNWVKVSILLVLLLIAGSTLYFFIFLPNQNKNKTIKAGFLFEQKLKCNSLKLSIENVIKDYNSQQKLERLSQNNALTPDDPQQTYGMYLNSKELNDFFYSPKLNTCLYVEIARTSLKTSGDSELGSPIEYWNPVYEYYNFIDALTGTTINSIRTISRGEKYDDFNDVQKTTNDLKD